MSYLKIPFRRPRLTHLLYGSMAVGIGILLLILAARESDELTADVTGNAQCTQNVCNVWKGSDDATCRAQTRTVASGKTCTYTGTIKNEGLIWMLGSDTSLPPSRQGNPTLQIRGANCNQDVVFASCGAQNFSVTCAAGPVSFTTNDTAFMELTETCSDVGATACGSANGVASASAPTANLCGQGTASAVTQNGNNWQWTCGSTQCSAPVSTSTTGTCGSAQGVATTTAPSANLCASGTASAVNLDGTNWKWTCGTTQCLAPQTAAVNLTLNPATQSIGIGQTPLQVSVSGGIGPYTVSVTGTNATGVTPSVDTATNTVRFSGAATAAGTLTFSVRDSGNGTGNGQITVTTQTASPLTGLQSFVISSSCNGQRRVIGDVCALVATGTFVDGSTRDISSAVTWEGFDQIGTVTNGTLTITKRRAAPETIATIVARTTTPSLIATNTLTITVFEVPPRILSIFTVGNRPFAKGVEAELSVRLASEEGTGALQDIEVTLLSGTFPSAATIPESAQRFNVVNTGLAASETAETATTHLIKVPVLIPLLSELREGPATLLVTIFTPSGSRVAAVAPIFVGVPPSGDADLNGRLELIDLILIMKMVNRELIPTPEQLRNVDFDRNGMVTILDALQVFRRFFSAPTS